MKKTLLLLLTIITFTLTGCTEDTPVVVEDPRVPVTEITIFGTRDKILPAGTEVELMKNVRILTDVDYDLEEYLELTSDHCTITDGVVNSSEAVLCTVTYNITLDGITAEETITIDYREPLREMEAVEEHNDIRMYQIYVSAYADGLEGGFGFGYGPSDHLGDLQGIIDNLDYIASLNVNAIWLTPIFESKFHSSMGEYEKRGMPTGYFADDYYNIDPNFGTNELFEEFVTEAHNRGLYVFLDGVFGHHGYYDIEGVTDGKSQWYGSEVEYPESLDYFTDVALYWIEEYNIDGWRLDQAYQLYQDNYNYFREIRNAVEDLSAERKANGEEWGTLGYFVAEIFDSSSNIVKYAYDNNAFRSAFNFPVRDSLVSVLAINDFGETGDLKWLNINMKGNNLPDYAQPNMFITNHDTLRFGDLIQIAGYQDTYFERHKLAISFLAAYTGPITLYYGDEYGDEFDGLTDSMSELNQYNYIAMDNVARTNGQFDNFTSFQTDLISYTTEVMNLRDTYDSLWNGERENLSASETIYADLKTSESNQILYIMGINTELETITLDATNFTGTTVTNLLTNETFTVVDGEITLNIDPLTAYFFLIE